MFRHKKQVIAAVAVAVLLSLVAVAVKGMSPMPVTVKLTPSMVSVDTSSLSPKIAQVEMRAVWRMFDRDTETAYAPSQTARVTVSLPEPRTISSIRIYGAASYLLNVYSDNNGTWEPVLSLSAKDLSTLGSSWNTLTASEPFTTGSLQLEFIPQGNITAGIREIELWSPESSTGQESYSQISLDNIRTPQQALDILAKAPSHILTFSAAPSEIAVNEGATPTVSIGIIQDPALFKRAYILYDGYNLVRSVSIQRRINGLSWSGGFVIPQPQDVSPNWSSYIEEINPAWLVQGENRIEFRAASGSVSIRGLQLIVETESGWNSVTSVTAPELYDGDITTSYKIAGSSTNSSVQINFERMVQPETIRLHIPNPANIIATLRYQNGTAWQDVKTGWQIDFSTMQSGWNEISIPAQVTTRALQLVFNTSSLKLKPGVKAGVIDEIRVGASPVGTAAGSPRIVISYPRDGEYFGRTAYIQGFAVPAMDASGNTAAVSIETKQGQQTVPDGSFSISLSKDDTSFSAQADDEEWDPVALSRYAGQPGAKQIIQLNKNAGAVTDSSPESESRGNAPFADKRDHHTEHVAAGQAKKIQYGGVTLDIPAGAVGYDTDITIVPLTEADLAHYNPGMINVTYPAAGYRFLPHGMKFNKPINISFGYAKQLFASGQTDNDVNMYYYDESLLRWQQLGRVKADPTTSQVISQSDHFTDIINSTLVVPEHPQALSFNPNSIKDIKAADPSANVNLIEPPKANSKGTANLSYPIEVPPGRNKMQPNLAIQYNSSGGNGWMGMGWDLPMQAITIDTRWGVPRYDTVNETETYTLDGEQLAPVAHRGLVARTPEKVFHPRVEGQFRKIIRHGTTPTNYWWEVIDKNGTKYFYGGGTDATLADPLSKNIFKWALRRIQDTNGNTVNYTYTVVSNTGIVGGTVMGYQIYLDKIDYTGHNDAPGSYSVLFTRDRETQNFVERQDVTIDARSGFKMVTADLLKRIEVHFKNSQGQDFLVRSYSFDYTTGAFQKTLLQAVSQNGSNNTLFNKHQFSYYDNVSQSDGSYNGFTSSTTWNTVADNIGKNFLGIQFDASALGGSEGTNIGESLYVGFAIPPVKHFSVGGKLAMSSSDTDGLIAMVDINGDGLPDKVFKCGNGVCYRLNTSGPHADLSNVTFSDVHQISGASVSDISRDHSDQISGGAQGYIAGASAIFDASSTMTTQSVYFADVNGDGLIDMVNNGVVYFNTGKLDASGNIIFSAFSADTPAPIIGTSGVNANGMLPDFTQLYNQMINQNPLLDSVRRWVAPYDGVISISGGVQLVDTTGDRANNKYTTADGVRVAVQKEGVELWSMQTGSVDYSTHTPTGVDNIPVSRGDRIYFRVQSVSDGSYDQVNWNPVITYVGAPTSQLDVNGLPVNQFTAGDDLVYGGRKFPIKLPFRGKLRISGDLTKKGVTTDDVAVAIYLNGVQIRKSSLAWDQPTGTITPTADDIDVQKDDVLTMKVLVDSDIDQKQIEWKPQVFYVEAFYPDITPLDGNGNSATDSSGNPVGPAPGSPVTVQDKNGNYIAQLKPLYDVEFYPANSLNAPQQSWTATQTGSILVTPYLFSVPTDTSAVVNFNSDVMFTVKRRTALLGKNDITIVSGSSYDPRQHSIEVAVNTGDELFFDFSTRDKDLAGKIPGVSATEHYINPAGAVNINNIAISLNGTANPPQKSWTATQDGTATITPVLATPGGATFGFDSTLTLNVTLAHTDQQGGNITTTLFSRPITIVQGSSVSSAAYAFDVPVAAGDVLSFSYTTADSSLPGQSITSGAQIRVTASIATTTVPSALHSNMVPTVFSKPYRGWGYIAYNGNGTLAGDPIHQELLLVSSNRSDYNLPLPTGTTQSNTSPQNFYSAIPDASQDRWISADQHWWIAPAVMSSSRLGLQYISVPAADKYNGATAVPRITQSSQTSVGGGYYIAISGAKSPTQTILDFMDMNGDGFPDVVGSGSVQYTTMLGTLESGGKNLGFGSVRDTETDALTIGPGGTVPDQQDDSKQKPPAKQESQNPSYGLSGSLGEAQSFTNCDMMDVNGDGLPDRVCQNNGALTVQLNLGYGFAQAENWGTANLNNGSNTNGSISVSYNDGVKGFAGGPSVSSAITQNEAALIDVNGDGLLDRVYNDGNNIYVGFNTGAGFAAPVLWNGSLDHRINSGLNASFAAGVSYSYPIGPLCIVECFIIINPEVNGGISMSREESMLRDVKGDGTADHLYSNSDGSLRVAVNRTQNTNLLKTVKRPLGGSITLDYKREGNTYDMPQSQWTMIKTTLTDGRGSSYVTAFKYENGYKDRFEREFYGFHTVTETHAPGTALERRVIETFNNSDFYLKGLLLQSVTTDKIGRVWAKSANTYTPAPVQGCDYTEFPALTRTDTYFYDGTTDEAGFKKNTYQTFAYDETGGQYGNVTTFFDAGEFFPASVSTDQVIAKIGYFTNVDVNGGTYIVKPQDIVVKGTTSSSPLRSRHADYDSTGNMTGLTLYNNGAPNSVWSMTYDANGNVHTITDPVSYKLIYAYDPDTSTYVTGITDNFPSGAGGPYYSTATYNPLFGQVRTSIDLNMNIEARGYDQFGRLACVYGPYDPAPADPDLCTGAPTIIFSYADPVMSASSEVNDLSSPALAVTKNRAVSVKGSDPIAIKTLTYADGMKRIIETKKDADVNGTYGTTVSGKILFDVLGRVVQQGQPIFEAGYSAAFTDQLSPQNPTLFAYDTLDRTVVVQTPDSKAPGNYATTLTSYTFGVLGNSPLYAKTAVVDPMGNSKESYKDVHDRIVAVIEHNGAAVATTYAYDPLGEITDVWDNKGNHTAVVYDEVGNRTEIDNPDTGGTVYNYDANGNLINKFTANHNKITYNYLFNRLTGIDYPNNLKTASVAYVYGAMGEIYNRAGRIKQVTDESGTEWRYYGKLGEVLKEERMVNAHTPSMQNKKFTTEYVFDSFGRMVDMTYPDGEALHYAYDNGGLLKAAWGEKSGNRYNYINSLLYDEYGQRTHIEYGNNTTTNYAYDPLTRRLATLVTTLNAAQANRQIQNLSYHYDLVGNVLNLANSIAVPTNTALPAGPVSQAFGYDNLYQITSAQGYYTFGPGKQNNYTNAFTYDTIGNMTQKTPVMLPSLS